MAREHCNARKESKIRNDKKETKKIATYQLVVQLVQLPVVRQLLEHHSLGLPSPVLLLQDGVEDVLGVEEPGGGEPCPVGHLEPAVEDGAAEMLPVAGRALVLLREGLAARIDLEQENAGLVFTLK